ncbi:MAG: RNA-directed DNA polymerase [Clostridia bacterium]|nr:RNA-directed DNA polymerase [Clostridia bacterium]
MGKVDSFKLYPQNLISKILEHEGLFCEHIPYCFSTKVLGNKFSVIKDDLAKISTNPSFPLSFTMSKNSLLRRTISVPNLISYIQLLSIYEKNWLELIKKAVSDNSESKFNMLVPFSYNTSFKSSIRTRNNKFVGYKVKLNIDIANCFDSIYTHSASWALVGKENAKKIFNKAHDMDESLKPLYDIGYKIDQATRKLNGDQTNGIMTGPYSSYLFAEIILSEIDRKLVEADFAFSRYVDDYGFYFYSKAEAETKIQEIASIFREYNLSINSSKIKIESYPYDLLDDFGKVFEEDIKNNDIYAVLHKALGLYKQEKKGAIKYAFKMLLAQGDMSCLDQTVLNMILGIVINIPEVSSLGIQLLEKTTDRQFLIKSEKRINQLLNSELKQVNDHESMWLLYLLTKMELPIYADNLRLAIKTENDLLIIMCLDSIQSNPCNIYQRNEKRRVHFEDMKTAIEFFSDEVSMISNIIKNEDYTGSHWLLTYEVAYNNFRLGNKIKIYESKSRSFYKILSQKDISFYNKIK